MNGPTDRGSFAPHVPCDCVDCAVKHGDQAPDPLELEIDRLKAEVERLKGFKPELPPFPPEGSGLPRFGLRWNGPGLPLAVPMPDGYWTPAHLAEAAVIAERDACARLVEFSDLFWHLTPADPRTRIAAAIRAREQQ